MSIRVMLLIDISAAIALRSTGTGNVHPPLRYHTFVIIRLRSTTRNVRVFLRALHRPCHGHCIINR
eukprot:5626029-Pyramimonas_sp.AAC.2